MFKTNDVEKNSKSKQLTKVQQTQKYMQNEMQINCIKKVLIEHSDVPETLLNWLIKSVQENVSLEYENYRT